MHGPYNVKSKLKLENNIKMDLQEVCWVGMVGINAVRVRGQW